MVNNFDTVLGHHMKQNQIKIAILFRTIFFQQ